MQYHIRQKHTAYVIQLKNRKATWEEYWFGQTGVEWETIMHSNKPVYVIIDEVHIAYPKDSTLYGLWAEVKEVLNAKRRQVRFVLIGSYGKPQLQPDGTPTPVFEDIRPEAIISLRPHNGTYNLYLLLHSFTRCRYARHCVHNRGVC